MSTDYHGNFVFHRIDDVGQTCLTTLRFLETFGLHGIYCVLAVVPDWLDVDMATMIRRLNCTVFQHGVSHTNRVQSGYPDEFPSTMELSEARKLISDGKQKLESLLARPIRGYVPPWNTTSPQTLEILKELGFTTFSGHDRFGFDTTLQTVNILVDVVSNYEPLQLRSSDNVLAEIRSIPVRSSPIGIMYHVTNLEIAAVDELARLVFEMVPRTISKEEFECLFLK